MSVRCDDVGMGMGGMEREAPPFLLLLHFLTCRTGGGAPPPRTAEGPAPRMWVRKAETMEGLCDGKRWEGGRRLSAREEGKKKRPFAARSFFRSLRLSPLPPHLLLWLIPVMAGQQDVALQVQEVERGDGGHED